MQGHCSSSRQVRQSRLLQSGQSVRHEAQTGSSQMGQVSMQFWHVGSLHTEQSRRQPRQAVSSHWWQQDTHSWQKSSSHTRHQHVSSLLMT